MSGRPFSAPSAERFQRHLATNEVRMPSPWAVRGPLLALLGAVVVALVMPPPLGALAPWIALIAVMIYTQRRSRRLRRLQAEARMVQELTMLRRYKQALRQGWRLLPQVVEIPTLHGRTVAMMAHCLDLAEAYDAAIVGYDYLLQRMSSDHPGAVQLRIQRATSSLFADRLSDADDELRRLRNSMDQWRDTPMHAGYLLAELIQDVRTHHFAEALTLCDHWTDALRPLGVEAGFGHALLALCHHEAGSTEQADQHWRWANTLLPTAALLHRFPELKLYR